VRFPACIFLIFVWVADALGATPTLRPAPRLQFPHQTDSNSPGHWDGDRLYLFNSAVQAFRSYGSNVFQLTNTVAVVFNNTANGGRWIEATWRAPDGTLYGWYHNEPAGLCPGTTLTAPRIGAARSTNNGANWTDLGTVLQTRPGTLKCTAQNGYFAGGNGDFCVMLDPAGEYLYFFFSTYAGDVTEQGVALARMAWNDRDSPSGKVWKWDQGTWQAPGIEGTVTPLFPAMSAWERKDCDAFWGPSVHWNTRAKQYVMLLNRAKGAGWIQEGIYFSSSTNLADPFSWSAPAKLLNGGAWYPQVMGLEPGQGTDKSADGIARFFMGGVSDYEISFENLAQSEGLAISRDGNAIQLSWPATLTDAHLQYSTDLSGKVWTSVTNATMTSNGRTTTTDDVSNLQGVKYFRLQEYP
jgi:hypothetical protein